MKLIVENENIKIQLYEWAGKLDIKTIQIKKFSDIEMKKDELSRMLDCIIEKHTSNKLNDYVNYNKYNQKMLNIEVICDFIRDYKHRDVTKLNFETYINDKDHIINFEKEIISFRGLKFDLNTLHCDFENFNLYKFSKNNLSSHIVNELINDIRFSDNVYIKLCKELIRYIKFTKGKKTVNIKLKDKPIEKTDDFRRIDYNLTLELGSYSIKNIEYIKYNKTEFRFNQQVINDALEVLKKEVYK